jgi:hypothetical protein
MLLLGRDDVTLYGPSTVDDSYGWAEPPPDDVPVWAGVGNLQLTGGISDPRASTGGGSGPFDPARPQAGQLFLPLDAPAAEGCTVDVRGQRYALSQTHLVADPIGLGLDCTVATVVEVGSWPQ